MIILLKRFKHNMLLFFTSAVVTASLLEYITGFLMEKIFKNTWWDYSDEPFNIAGRICLKNSLIWGAIAIIMLYILHPLIKYAIGILIPENIKSTAAYFILIYFISDFIIASAFAAGETSGVQVYNWLANMIKHTLKHFCNAAAKGMSIYIY